MDNKITRFNCMMLETFKREESNYNKIGNLFNLYLLGYIKQIKSIDKIEELNNSYDNHAIEKRILEAFTEISRIYPILKDSISEFNNERKLKPEVLSKLTRTVLDLPFNKEEWKDAIENFIDILSYEINTINIIQTPKSLNKLGIDILKPINGTFYDGSAGVNGTVITAHEYSINQNGNLDFYTQEINSMLVAIGTIRVFINGIKNIKSEVGDTLLNPVFIEEKGIKKFDFIMMDFPFGQSWRYDENNLIYDKYSRYIYGKPTKSSSEWLYVSHIIKSLKEEGKGVAMVTSSSLFNTGTESIRKNIIQEDVIEAIIGLPGGLFSHTSIAVNMLIINKNKKFKNKILFINAEDMATAVTRAKKELNDENIELIVDIYKEMKEVDEVSKLVDISDIENHLLIPSKYVAKLEVNTENFGVVKIKQGQIKALKGIKKFSEVASFYRGISTSTCTLNEEDGEYKIINLSDVQDGELKLDTIAKYDIKSNSKIDSYTVKEGDIIISAKGNAIKIGIIPKHQEKLLISQNFIGVKLDKGYLPSFIKEYLESPLGMYLIESKQLGSTITMLNTKDLKEIDIVTLPIETQDEIITEYQSKAEEIKERMKELETQSKELQLELYKQMGIEKTIEI